MKKQVAVTSVYQRNLKSRAGVVLNQGGARSSKSYSIGQLFVQKFINEDNKKFLVTRKTLPALRVTAYKLITDLLEEYGYLKHCRHNKSERTISFKNNWMYFTSLTGAPTAGMSPAEKIKSTEFNYAWLEEANEFTWDDFIILHLRMSAQTIPSEPNQMFLTYNPSDSDSWIAQRLPKKHSCQIIHSTYSDNPFLSTEYIAELEALRDEDENYYLIYAKGQYGTRLEKIYGPYIENAAWPSMFEETVYGLDFGYSSPCALLEVGLIGLKDVWLTEKLYETGLTNSDLIDRLKVLILDKRRPIYADSAEPDRIEEIRREGFNVVPCDKSVGPGLDYCRRMTYYTRQENVNLNAERARYSFRKDRNGNVLDVPVDYFDHLMACKRYALWTHFKLEGERRRSRLLNLSGLRYWSELPEMTVYGIVADSKITRKLPTELTAVGLFGLDKNRDMYLIKYFIDNMTFTEVLRIVEYTGKSLNVKIRVVAGFDNDTFNQALPLRWRRPRLGGLSFKVKKVNVPSSGKAHLVKLDSFINNGRILIRGSNKGVDPEHRQVYEACLNLSAIEHSSEDVLPDMISMAAELLLEGRADRQLKVAVA